jgi:hypothetical protein
MLAAYAADTWWNTGATRIWKGLSTLPSNS